MEKNRTIVHLRYKNFNPDGTLKNRDLYGKVVIIMVYGSFCHYCHEALPAFLESARFWSRNKKVWFGAIQIDGSVPGEKECDKLIPKFLPSFQGVPDYVVFVNNMPIKIDFLSRSSAYINEIVFKLLRVKDIPYGLH